MSSHFGAVRSAVAWRLRRPWTATRLRRALADGGASEWTPRELAGAAGIPNIPPGALRAAVTALIERGAADGTRGDDGWVRVRPARHAERRAARSSRPVPPGPATTGEGDHAHPAVGERLLRALVPWGRRGGQLRSAPALPAAGGAAIVAARSFSITARAPLRRDIEWAAGLLLFALAAFGAATIGAVVWRETAARQARTEAITRGEWYRVAARAYVARSLAGEPGFALPSNFTTVTGVGADAPRPDLERGMMRYVRAALFTGAPDHAGLLTWVRGELGAMPAGAAGEEWVRQAAATFVSRATEGRPGYTFTPELRAFTAVVTDEPDTAALQAGVERAIRAGLEQGTPNAAGVLEWARRTFGELPAE